MPLSSSKGYYREQQSTQPSVFSSGHHAGKPQPVTPTSNREAQRAYSQQIRDDEISAGIQNLSLRANPSHSGKDLTAGENRHSRSSLPPREVSPLGWVAPGSKSASAASYNPVSCRNESKTPPNSRSPRAKSTALYPTATHYSHSSTRRRDEPALGSSVRSHYVQRCFYELSTPDDSPLPSDESWSVSDSPRSSDESWLSDHYNDDAPPYFEDFW